LKPKVKDSRTSLFKATYNDKREYISQAIKDKFNEDQKYCYVTDFDDTHVYFEVNDYSDGGSYEETLKLSYSMDGVNVTLGNEEPIKVVRESVYTEVSDMDKEVDKSITKTIVEAIKDGFKSLTSSSDTNVSASIKAFKKDNSGVHRIEKFNEMLQISYDPLYCGPCVADSDGEAMSEETIIKMVESVNKGIKNKTLKPVLFHKIETKSFEFIEAFVNPWPTAYINAVEIMKGQPVLVTHYLNEAAWELRKSGKIMGPSVGAVAMKVVDVKDDVDEVII